MWQSRDPVSVTFVGNATTLLRWRSFTLLTDPNFLHAGELAYLGHGLVSKRLREPAIQIEELPDDIDSVLLSHLHGDHWDRAVRRKLDRGTPIVTTPHAARRLQGWHGFRRATGLRTWESQNLLKHDEFVRVTALPGLHAPGPARFLLPPVMGSLVEFGSVGDGVGFRLYITGDTLLFDGVREIARRCPDIDVVVAHLGGTTLPGGLLVTMDARQGADLLEVVPARTTIPVHTDDYTVFKSSLEDFEAEVRRRGLQDKVTYLGRGETVEIRPGAGSGGSSP
ncbi:L-ascorbate metabolism protein UlaG, beta-lactamase superfamily [Saccharopolyspora kobensis]|uniref:L-ascorbate metabolism protein UlaG, beta-lactamase superfamily n=1 Tax=Saccharopolyspora kobensis TaxID=146035 RepID=A0A1H5VKQ2_9PSEU|nr:MBL fold metallo-hydrolase [Saccharopolyspora kobensis]SEF87596.1 L-ascorbate metabolism protein UlaG, beta-lactamase superfamily [Saccharopolyspora kobensis]SFC60014.1 L-ascorbate metabolism protein UlaG, beta-lactamase superfamily [Saccharopolyspora kobensis]